MTFNIAFSMASASKVFTIVCRLYGSMWTVNFDTPKILKWVYTNIISLAVWGSNASLEMPGDSQRRPKTALKRNVGDIEPSWADLGPILEVLES
jgi:hypothetical protein